MKIFKAGYIYTGEKLLSPGILLVDNHRVVGVKQDISKNINLSETTITDFGQDALICPGTVNSHNHSFQSLARGFAVDKDFLKWRDEGVYRVSERLTDHHIYLGALFAFSEMLLNGITTVCDFFYINEQSNKNVEKVIAAAQDCGIRIVIARCMYDWQGAPPSYIETVEQAVKNTYDLAQKYNNDPCESVKILPAPHSPHGASFNMIKEGVSLSKELGVPMHMHIAEEPFEVEEIKNKFGMGLIEYLEKAGALFENLVGVHCVWLKDDEKRIFADAGCSIAYNPASNMFLGDGITDIPFFHKQGVTISLGTDGGCSNNRVSIFDEMRTCALLHRVNKRDPSVFSTSDLFKMGTINASKTLAISVGCLKEGYYADFIVIDTLHPSITPRRNLLANIIYSMQPDAIKDVYVGGRLVVKDRHLLTVEFEKIVNEVNSFVDRL